MRFLQNVPAVMAGLFTVVILTPGHVTAADRPPTPVEAVKVSTQPLAVEATAVGTLISNEAVVIRPEIEGRVVEIAFEEGGRVSKGQLLFKLDDSIYKAELEDAKARMQLATSNFARAKELYQKSAGTERGRDEAQSAYRVAEAAVALAQARLTKTTIEAPFEGYVGLRDVSVGDYVSAGQDLVNIEDIEPLKVEFAVPERYLEGVRSGQTVNLTADAFPSKTFEGEIYAINPKIDSSGRSIQVRARIANDERILRPGLFVRVKVQLGHNDNAVMIPEQAVVPRGRDRFVFKIVDGKAVETKVQIGQRRVGQVEVVEGLSPDDVVVTAGQLKIRDGAPVKPLEEAAAPSDAPKDAGDAPAETQAKGS